MKYDHAFTIAFSLKSDHEGKDVPSSAIRNAIIQRLQALDDDELLEAVGLPFDTFEND